MTEPLEDVRAALADRYRVDRVLGAGGMATVYLALDLESDSLVAIKVLREQLGAVVGRERFIREVQIASQLDHPGIVRVLGSGEANGIVYCIMPYIDGETLRDVFAREKQISVARAVAFGCEVAEALAYAHEKGFVHRDIKPANLLVSGDRVVITDFGIARAVHSSTDAESMTTSGIVIGTPAYMAPEQASHDRDVDGRADIYALGCVIYEALVGEPPYAGLTAWNVAARLAAQPPVPIRVLRSATPPSVERVIMRALEKTPADRFPTARAFASELANASRADAAPVHRWRRIGIGALVVAAATIAAWAGITRFARANAPQLVTFVVPPPAGAEFTDDLRDVSAVSPDGNEIIIAGTDSNGVRNLWLRRLSEAAAHRIDGTDFGTMAFWSPDGKAIAFFKRRALQVIDRAGGVSRTLVAETASARGGSWADDGTILYAPSSQSAIFAVSLKDSTPRQLTTVSPARGEIGHMWPQSIPGGRDFLYFVASAVDSVRGIYLASMDSPRGRRVVGSPASAVYSNGYLLYVREGALVAQQLDLATASLAANRRRIADSVATSYEYYGAFSASRAGVLVYASGRSRDISRLSWLDSAGTNRGYASNYGYLRNPALSADGRYLAFETYRETHSDIQYIDLATGVSSVLPGVVSGEQLQATDPVWSPDGSAIAFIAEQPRAWNIYRKYINQPGAPELLFRSTREAVLMDWSPDGSLILNERNDAGDFELVARPAAAPGAARMLAHGPGHRVAGRVSPDGKSLVYVSLESGQAEVYAERLPTTGVRCRVSVAGGYQPAWGKVDGQVYFLSASGAMMRATLDPSRPAPCPVSAPRALFETNIRSPSRARSFFDVSMKDGLLLVNAPSAEHGAWLTVIMNWLAVAP